jgi:hypothetical protein
MPTLLLLSFILMSACATASEPVIIHDSPRLAVTLRPDPQAGSRHDHPAALTPTVMATVLKGIRITKRDPLGLGGIVSDDEANPAFSASDIAGLALYLSEGLGKASREDLATFYLVSKEPSLGKVVTSGGLFVEGGRVFLILANARTPPSAGPFEGTAYELDTKDDPLFSIARYRFAVTFTPAEALVPHGQLGARVRDRYTDPAKLIVIDLAKLSTSPR